MSVFKEINKADGSGVTQFFRLSTEKQTVETNDYGDFYNFKGGVASRKDLPTTKLETGDAYFIEDEEKTVFWDGTEWREINTYVLNYNYNDASNKPLINGHVLSGDKSAAELELQPAGDYLTEIPEEYITEKELEDLDLADKNYVIDQINNTEHFHREIVDGLPVIGKDNVIYMVKKKSASGDDIYDEWMWVDTKYEHIGSTATDLSDYYKKEEADKLLDKKVDKVTGKGLSTNDYTTTEKTKLASLENYDDTAIKAELATLHNYDDTDIKNDITALKTAENGLKTDVSDIKEELKDKIEGVRLVRSGDMWDFYTVGGTRLTYEAARELLGHPNTILYMEGVENDGKTTPADYDIDEELIHVHYMDEDGEDRYLQMGYPNTASAEGSYIHIEDAVAQPLNSLTIEGVTEQKTRKGVNLYNYQDVVTIEDDTVANDDGWITFSYNNTDGTNSVFRNYYTHNLDLKTDTNYNIVMEVKTVSVTGTCYIHPVSINSTTRGQFTKDWMLDLTSLSNNTIQQSVLTTKSSFQNISEGLRTFMSISPGASASITFRLSVLEDTTITANNFEYEAYGISPSPNFPSNIKTISGIKNLLDINATSSTSSGITCINNHDGSITINGHTTEGYRYHLTDEYLNFETGKKYTISAKILSGSCTNYSPTASWSFMVMANSGNTETMLYIAADSKELSRTFSGLDDSGRPSLWFGWNASTTEKNARFDNLRIQIMIEEGDTSHSYVPCGIYEKTIMTGKNLCDSGTYTLSTDNASVTWNKNGSSFIPVSVGDTLTISYYVNGIKNETSTYGYAYAYAYSADKKLKSNQDILSSFLRKTATITDSSVKYIRVFYGIKGTQGTQVVGQVEKGTIATDYEPYKQTEILIDLKGNELCSLPNGTKDELTIKNNRVKINKKIGKIILDGENNQVTQISLHNGVTYVTANIYNNIIAKVQYSSLRYLWSDKLSGASLDTTWKGGQYFTISQGSNGSYVQLCLPQSYGDFSFTTAASINSFLVANPITVYFLLKEPETIDLGEIDMPTTFEGVNNITVDSDLNPNIKIDYVTNVNYLDKNIGFKNHYIGYYEDAANLPTGNKGDIATVSSDKRIYINDGNEWIPSDKNSTVDLTNYLAKDNTTGYTPTDNYNPATKKYVDDSIKNINIPAKTSQLTNDSNFVIKTTNELTNYYTKNNTYTKSEVNALVSGSGGSTEATWGSITGTLNDQTDLKEALAAKADTTALPNMSNYATKTYADNCKLENVSANEGNMIFGPTYDETSYGGQLTSLSPSTITNIKIGQVYVWINPTGSGMGADVNYAVVTGILQQSGTNYTTRTIYMGNQMSYVYAYDSTKVYKGSYGG